MQLLNDRPVALHRFALPRDRVFPQPHSKLFQPSEADTARVRDLASRARDQRTSTTDDGSGSAIYV
jgi:hypothetical protein